MTAPTPDHPEWQGQSYRAFSKKYRMLSYVPRWAVAPKLNSQSVAEHSYYVALYADQICNYLGLSAERRANIVGWALRHDAHEIWTSDLPGPAKRHFVDPDKMNKYDDLFAEGLADYGGYRSTDDDLRDKIVAIADLVDEVFYLKYELVMGNGMVVDLLEFSLAGLGNRLSVWFEDAGGHLFGEVVLQLERVENEGALIPSFVPGGR